MNKLIKELNKIEYDPLLIADGINMGHFKLLYIINKKTNIPEIIGIEGNQKKLEDNLEYYLRQIKGIYGI